MSKRRRWSRGGGSPSSLQHRLPFTNDEVDEEDFLQASTTDSPGTRPWGIIRDRSFSTGHFQPSSLGHRIPARSFAHSTSGAIEPLQYSSHGVREQTQQLASWGLEQPSSTLPRSSSQPQRAPPSASDADFLRGRRAGSSSRDSDNGDEYESIDSSLPEIIPEVSEPDSPEHVEGMTQAHSIATVPQVRDFFGAQSRQGDQHGTERVPSSRNVPDVVVEDMDASVASETTALLPKAPIPPTGLQRTYKDPSEAEEQPSYSKSTLRGAHSSARYLWSVVSQPKTWSPTNIGRGMLGGGKAVVMSLPAVFLGWLLNVLDALSYGTILFPLGESIFEDTGPDGIAIFFVSTIISQIVFSSRSRFKGGVGSEMIEVVPFFHKMAYLIMQNMDGASVPAVMSTVYISYCLSSILTGIIFLLLGVFKLGNLVSFFPRSILTGCIGGVGIFLFITGIEVSAGISGNLEYNLATLQKLVALDTLPLWTIPLLLSVILFIIKLFSERPWILPAYFISIMAIFYIVAAAVPALSLDKLRNSGWIFQKPQSGVAFYHFYTYYNLKLVDWTAILECLPTMLALSFFGIIHVPINIPALALATQEDDINTNQELVNHGVSNALSGFAGSIQNYLVYANSQLFIRNGGNSRLAGFLLALATLATWMAGPDAIGFIPKMIVGTLIYLLGIDLVKEALWDTVGRIHLLEYLMILVIALVMGFHDFVVGIMIGIILSSLLFVTQTSRISAVRAVYSGTIAESTVRRHPIHRRFLHAVGSQLRVFKLAGYLFFGTIVDVEKNVRYLLHEDEFSKAPIRFLIFDLLHVTGLDFSAAEAFGRIRRLLHSKGVAMILSGISMSGELGSSLAMVGLFAENEEDELDEPPRIFEDLNKALEACENDQLIAFRGRSEMVAAQRGRSPMAVPVGVRSNDSQKTNPLDAGVASPRRSFLQRAATTTLSQEDVVPPSKWSNLSQPLLLMLQTFRNLSDKDLDFWYRAAKYFRRVEVEKGHILFSVGDAATGFYILEEGVLTCTYEQEQGNYQESIVAGTTCGELPFFAGIERSATVVAETDIVAWLLDRESWEKLRKDWPEGECELLRVGLRLTSERMNAVTSYVLVNAS